MFLYFRNSIFFSSGALGRGMPQVTLPDSLPHVPGAQVCEEEEWRMEDQKVPDQNELPPGRSRGEGRQNAQMPLQRRCTRVLVVMIIILEVLFF